MTTKKTLTNPKQKQNKTKTKRYLIPFANKIYYQQMDD